MTTINAVNTTLSGQTGSGTFVGSNSPTLITPALGTPASGNLANCTGYAGGSGIPWTVVTASTLTIAANNGYVSNNATGVTFTLPTTAAVGTMISIAGLNASAGWVLDQNASQLIHVGSAVTTTGTGGSLASTNNFDSINLICVVANTTWVAVGGPQGNLTVV